MLSFSFFLSLTVSGQVCSYISIALNSEQFCLVLIANWIMEEAYTGLCKLSPQEKETVSTLYDMCVCVYDNE